VLFRIVSILGTFISVVSLVISFAPDPSTLSERQTLLLALSGLFFIGIVVFDIIDYFKRQPKKMKTEKQIMDYMHGWISRGGRVHIFSRDLSWVHNEEMKELLRRKALSGELNITLPQRIPLLDELQKLGASTNIYPDLDYVPQSRFTIANWERMDARVAEVPPSLVHVKG
jgi:hypothetical protein